MKQFLIIGNINALIYKEVFPYIKDGIIKYRPHYIKEFVGSKRFGNIAWYTTLTVPELPPLELTKAYNPIDYPKYDNYDAIEVSRTKDIPYDYDGVMGVPITFLDHYNPSQFEIINGVGRYACIEDGTENPIGTFGTDVNGKHKYFRILIRRIKN